MRVDWEEKKINIKVGFYRWFRRWWYCLPVVFLGAAMFVVAIMVGGSNLASIAIALMFVAAGLPRVNISLKGYLAYYGALLLCAELGVLASMNYMACVVINFIAIFLITYLSGDDFLEKNHFMFGFILIMPQNQRLTLEAVPDCLIICVLCFALMSIFAFFRKRMQKQSSGVPLLERGCFCLARRLRNFDAGPSEEMHLILKEYSRNIYGDVVKQFGKMNEGQTWQYQILLYLAQLEYLLQQNEDVTVGAEAKSYFEDLAALLENTAQNHEAGCYALLGDKIVIFLENHSLKNRTSDARWRMTLQRFADELGGEARCFSRKFSLLKGISLKIRMLRQNFHLRSGILRFALKTSILTSTCFAISYIIPVPRSYWLPMTVYSMLMVFHDDESKSATARLVGTVLGMVFYVGVTEFLPIPNEVKMLLILFVGFSLIFSFSDTRITMLIGTQMSMGSLFPAMMSMEDAALLRLVIVLGAVVVVVLGGLLIFRTEREDALRSHFKNLLYCNGVLVKGFEQALSNEDRMKMTTELILAVQMYIDEIEILAKTPELLKSEDLETIILPGLRNFLLDMIQAFLIYNHASKEEKFRTFFKTEIVSMKEELRRLGEHSKAGGAPSPCKTP